MRKHLTIALESPEKFDVFELFEKKYENFMPPTITGKQRNQKPPIRFFRGNLSVSDIKNLSQEYFERASDDSKVFVEHHQMMLDLDSNNGCIESCEVF